MGSNELRFFDGAGRHLLAVGRPGNGPGEFRQVGFRDGTLIIGQTQEPQRPVAGPQTLSLTLMSVAGLMRDEVEYVYVYALLKD